MISLRNYAFISLSETQLFQSDIPLINSLLGDSYCFFLNSDDLHDPSIPLQFNRSLGGTMFLWRRDLDPYVEIIKPSSPSHLAALFKYPGCALSVHFTIYMPTQGKDQQFFTDYADLRNSIDDINNSFDHPILYLRGDLNINPKNKNRHPLLQTLLQDYQLNMVELRHPTYHHFMGNGLFDSPIDVLLYSNGALVGEEVVEILCKKENPAILSHHDMIISKFSSFQNFGHDVIETQDIHLPAPRLYQERRKISWNDEGIVDYQMIVGPHLAQLRENWQDFHSQTNMSILLSLTNDVLNIAAKSTNKSKLIGSSSRPQRKYIPRPIKTAMNKLNRIYKRFSLNNERMKAARKEYRSAIRLFNHKSSLERDQRLSEILSKTPSKFYRYLKNKKKSAPSKIERLTVNDKLFLGDAVGDGFYESMSTLKSCNFDDLIRNKELGDSLTIYEHVIKLCENDKKLPSISLEDSLKLLLKIKKNVKDYYGITALHYLNAGEQGLLHFNFLLNAVLQDVSNAASYELNLVHGLILHKGHNKDKSSHRSYRTISTCPFIAKCLDLYLRWLYQPLWDAQQADTQFQGSGSNHELASLLATEVVQHSLFVAKTPVYLLALDAQSAFDRCLPQIIINILYEVGLPPAAVNFFNNRLRNRKTVYEWDSKLMGPARDDIGVEQGGINSSDLYKIYNNSQLKDAQESGLGVNLGSCTVAAIGQADDVLLASNDIYELQLLCHLAEVYCKRHNVILEPKKTTLVPFARPDQAILVEHAKATNNVTINGVSVPFSNQMDHVGVLRNINGNMAHVLHRIAQHKKALASIMFSGTAKSHRANPAASLRVHMLYCTPVLLSGLGSLVLSSMELKTLDHHYTTTLQRLQRLYDRTPRAFVHLLAGSLPLTALLAMRKMSLFHMICLKPNSPLHIHAKHVLSNKPPGSRSWFLQITDLCQEYGLNQPLNILNNPPDKIQFKRLVKLKVCEYWQKELASECSKLPSLVFFDPTRASLLRSHAIWTYAGNNSYEVNKSIVAAKMLSGRYRTEALSRHWSGVGGGFCVMSTCDKVLGDLQHLLLKCPAFHDMRARFLTMWRQKLCHLEPLLDLFMRIINGPDEKHIAFLLNPSANPDLQALAQTYGSVVIEHSCYLTRTFIYNIHREKLKLTGKWTNSL